MNGNGNGKKKPEPCHGCGVVFPSHAARCGHQRHCEPHKRGERTYAPPRNAAPDSPSYSSPAIARAIAQTPAIAAQPDSNNAELSSNPAEPLPLPPPSSVVGVGKAQAKPENPDVDGGPSTRNRNDEVIRALAFLEGHVDELEPGFERRLFFRARYAFSPNGSGRLSEAEREKLFEIEFVLRGTLSLSPRDQAFLERAKHPLEMVKPDHDRTACRLCQDEVARSAEAAAMLEQELAEMAVTATRLRAEHEKHVTQDRKYYESCRRCREEAVQAGVWVWPGVNGSIPR